MTRSWTIALAWLALLGWALHAGTAHAQFPLALDAGWTFDRFEAINFPNSQNSLDPVAKGYDFTLIGPARLTITDCCLLGDRFDLLDDTTLLASSVYLAGVPFGDNLGTNPATFDAALADASYHGIQSFLPPGSYQIRLQLAVLGGGYPVDVGVRLDSVEAIPSPTLGAWGGLLAVLAFGLAAASQRREAHRWWNQSRSSAS